MSAHTPGPWTFFTEREATPDRPNTMKFLKGVDGQGFAHTVGLSEPTDTANARLIAAAPELLSALKAACQDIRLAAEIHKAKGLEAASHELRTHEQIYQNVIRLAEGRG